MEANHRKGSCDPIDGTVKRKDLSKTTKLLFKTLTTSASEQRKPNKQAQFSLRFCQPNNIKHLSFLSQAFSAIEVVKVTMKLHAISSHQPNRIWVRERSHFCPVVSIPV